MACPAKWYYHYHFKPDLEPEPDYLYYEVFRRTLFDYMSSKALGVPVTKLHLVEEWARNWCLACHKHKIDADVALREGLVGVQMIVKVVTEINHVYQAVLPGFSWSYKWEGLDTHLRGDTVGLLVEKGRSYDRAGICVLEVLHPSNRFRSGSYALRVLQVAAEAYRTDPESKATDSAQEIWTLSVHPWRGTCSLIRPGLFRPVETIIGNAINQMRYYLVVPHEGPHCGQCRYEKACSPVLATSWYVEHPEAGKLEVEEKCKTDSDSSSLIYRNTLTSIMESGYRYVQVADQKVSIDSNMGKSIEVVN